MLNLARPVQLCTDIGTHLISRSEQPVPTTMRGVFDALRELGAISPEVAERLGRATGFRNIAIHRYDDIDWNIVYRAGTESLDDFRRFARQIDDFCLKR